MTKSWKTLYCKSVNNELYVWEIYTVGNTVYKNYGKCGGQLITSKYNAIPVNIGKANYRTAEQQAITMANSEYNNKIKDGYVDVKENAKQLILDYTRPMKAKKFVPNTFVYPAIGQPKLNGVRATIKLEVVKDGLFTTTKVLIKSKGGIYYDIPHIELAMSDLYSRSILDCKNIVFDGEIYLENTHVGSIAGAAKNRNNPLNKSLKFIIYDLAIPNISQIDRIWFLSSIGLPLYTIDGHSRSIINDKHIFKLETHAITDDNHANEFRDLCLNNGFEGAIIRAHDEDYKFGIRTDAMMKLKKHFNKEFRILDIISSGKNEDQGKFILQNDINDLTFEAVPAGENFGSFEHRREYLKHKDQYIGKSATVKYYERTVNGKPFHANVIAIGREDYEGIIDNFNEEDNE